MGRFRTTRVASEWPHPWPFHAQRRPSAVALSSDVRDRAQAMADKLRAPALRVGYDLGLAQARAWGLHISTSRGTTSIDIEEPALFSEPGVFIVRPDGTLYCGAVQTMPFARPHFDELLAALDFALDKNYRRAASTPGRCERAGARISGSHWVRRRVLMAASCAWTDIAGLPSAIVVPPAWVARSLVVTEPMRRVHAGGPTGVLGIGAGGSLWAQLQRMRVAALGDTVGGFHRWLAPTTQGTHLVAVHTPHIGGVLHVYRLEGQQPTRRRLTADVSTHAIGSCETDIAGWVRDRLVLPSQDGRLLRVLNPTADWPRHDDSGRE